MGIPWASKSVSHMFEVQSANVGPRPAVLVLVGFEVWPLVPMVLYGIQSGYKDFSLGVQSPFGLYRCMSA